MPDRARTTTQATGDDEDWATIQALLKAGCSLPDRLQRKYDAHMCEATWLPRRQIAAEALAQPADPR